MLAGIPFLSFEVAFDGGNVDGLGGAIAQAPRRKLMRMQLS
jgi:hypothetical protein